MAKNNTDTRNDSHNHESQQSEPNITEQNRGTRQNVNDQQNNMESQPGSLSGIGEDNQRVGSDDAGVRGSDMGSTGGL